VKRPLLSLPVVIVVWEDAHGSVIGDYTVADAVREFKAPTIYKTIGLLVHEDDAMVLLACDECVSDPGYRGINKIPRGMVREVIRLPVPRRAKARRGPTRAALVSPASAPASA
jgi:hypothetical protein